MTLGSAEDQLSKGLTREKPVIERGSIPFSGDFVPLR